MRENRAARRISMVAKGELRHKSQCLRCRLENISLTGALVSLEDSAREPIPPGADCILTLRHGEGANPVDVTAQVVHYGFGLVGLNFGCLDNASGVAVSAIINGAGGKWGQVPEPV